MSRFGPKDINRDFVIWCWISKMCQLKWSAIIEKLTSFICELTFLFRSHVHVSTKSVARDFVLSIDVTCDHVWNKLQIKYTRQILNTDLTNKLTLICFHSGQFFWVSINTLVTVLKARDWLWELCSLFRAARHFDERRLPALGRGSPDPVFDGLNSAQKVWQSLPRESWDRPTNSTNSSNFLRM